MAKLVVCLLVLLSGLAALSWEIIWQLKSSLSLGVSALGTAITLATTMAGMALGSVSAARFLSAGGNPQPLKFYAGLEVLVGLSGLALTPAFGLVEQLDVQVYRSLPAASPVFLASAIALVLGLPSAALGATIPVYGLIAGRFRTSLSVLYGLNTLGAALGCLGLAFLAIPQLGVQASIYTISAINFGVALGALALDSAAGQKLSRVAKVDCPSAPRWELGIAFLTGFATFCLEVAWFRALRAAFQTTTTTFAILLTAVLISLTVGAQLARRRFPLGKLLTGAGMAILLVTPLIERFDSLEQPGKYWLLLLKWLACSVGVLGPPMALLGAALPTLFDLRPGLANWSRLYTVNTMGAVLGSLAAGWVLLPALGFVATAWLVGVVIGLVGLALDSRWRSAEAVGLATALTVAWATRSGIGLTRVVSCQLHDYRILSYLEGPDSSVAVVEGADAAGSAAEGVRPDESRMLVIDGFVATSNSKSAHYMAWMGRVPMLLNANPKRALVICFGTGQTVNAVRQEGPEWIDVVDINPRVFQCAPFFAAANQNVLSDPRVHPTVMDGRSWLRRTQAHYDVITLEPMPPRQAGVNSLYSREFYQLAATRLNPGGIVAQWLPFHLQTPIYSMSMAAAFRSVFQDSIIWQDPNGDAILVGRLGGQGLPPLGSEWPGLNRAAKGRDMTEEQIRACGWFQQDAMAYYAQAPGREITDDNQMLAYGGTFWYSGHEFEYNMVWVHWAHNQAIVARSIQVAHLLGARSWEELLTNLQREMASGWPVPPSWPGLRKAREEARPDPRFRELIQMLDQLVFQDKS
ncbi:MAG: fused MFS/spermidine synthase [Candidatus Eremiobacteraeota bacterium]|nr:fused MFS/spermidine synthase [Candidatus Eremiobacteraeota bacterium]MCW5871171.1 fused MFS/spermidine synthase [Candidatus Eremiobacteraeota bacterium]